MCKQIIRTCSVSIWIYTILKIEIIYTTYNRINSKLNKKSFNPFFCSEIYFIKKIIKSNPEALNNKIIETDLAKDKKEKSKEMR